MSETPLYIGCAGWSLAREYWPAFEGSGTHLERYASRLTGVEINSSFYRTHRSKTYAKWAESVEAQFRFSVKIPKTITHEHRLMHCSALLNEFLSECSALGDQLGCLLIQLPPSLVFNSKIVEPFFQMLRSVFSGDVILEPRHESWVEAKTLLINHHIAQAAVDPSRVSNDDVPGGWPGVRYWRLHGSPKIYYSAYDETRLHRIAKRIQSSIDEGVPTWCIFDNTTRGAATANALALLALLQNPVSDTLLALVSEGQPESTSERDR